MHKIIFISFILTLQTAWAMDPPRPYTPSSLKSVEIPDFAFGLVQVGTKLYITCRSLNSVIPIDEATLILKDPIVVGERPMSIVASGTMIYVGISGERAVSIIDAQIDMVVDKIKLGSGEPIGKFESGIRDLTILKDKLYVANNKDKTLWCVDLQSHQAVAQPLTSAPSSLAKINDALYIFTDQNILKMDTNTEKISIVSSTRKGDAFLSSGSKLCFENQNVVRIYDPEKMQEIKNISRLYKGPILGLASLGRMIFVSYQRDIGEVLIFDSCSQDEREIGSFKLPKSSGFCIFFTTADAFYARVDTCLFQIKGISNLVQENP